MRTIAAITIATVALAACSNATPTASDATTPPAAPASTSTAPATTAPATTTTTTAAPPPSVTIDPVRRNQAVNQFLDAVAQHIECTSFECITGEATYNRLDNLRKLATAIQGGDIADWRRDVIEAWNEWDNCVGLSGGDRAACTDGEAELERAIRDMYDALR